jgi:D-3-phosphoglycerate dehydrogenase
MPDSPNILITTSTFGVEGNSRLEQLERAGFSIYTNPYSRRLTEDEIYDLVVELQPIGVIAGLEPLTRRVLAAAGNNLRIISRCGTGIDNVNLEAAKEFAIQVKNTPAAPSRAVAELTLGAILNLLRHIAKSDRAMRQGEFNKKMGRLLGACTVGIIGYGHIGRNVAALCNAFGCTVIAYDVVAAVNGSGVEFVTLETLLRTADVVSLHIPSPGESVHFMTRERLTAMKAGAILINHARGDLVDETALYELVKAEHLGGAALDVFESEPYQGPLTELENVLLTPHVGSYAIETRVQMELEATENLFSTINS